MHLSGTDAFQKLTHTVQGTAALLPLAEQIHDDWISGHAVAAATRLLGHSSPWAKGSPWSDVDKAAACGLSYPLETTVHGLTITSESRIEDDGVLVRITAPYEREVFVRIGLSSQALGGLRTYTLSLDRSSPSHVSLFTDGFTTWVHTESGSIGLGTIHTRTHARADHGVSGELVIISPIPGKVVAVSVAPGATVQEGEVLVVLDSMKMEHPFKAPRSGVVTTINVTQGALVHAGTTLAVIS
jgi:acetyl/propionyl-CoA carboxylase alpha subunit